MTERRLTRAELHRRSGVPLSTLKRIESGAHTHPPNLRHLVDLAEALDLPLEAVLEDRWLRPTSGGPPVAVAGAGAPGQPRSVLDETATLVRWLNSGNIGDFPEIEPERVVVAQARALALAVVPQPVVVGYPAELRTGWLVFEANRPGARVVAVIVQLNDGYQLLA